MRSLFFRKMAWVLVTVLMLGFGFTSAEAALVDIRAWIDDTSDLIIQGNTVQWYNSSSGGRVPGYWGHDSTPLPTTLGGTDWYPIWEGGTTGYQYSNIYSGFAPALASLAQTVTLTETEWREPRPPNGIAIIQQPSLGNDYKLIIRFADVEGSGAAYYTARIEYAAVPIPAAAWLLASGLLGLIGVRRRFKK